MFPTTFNELNRLYKKVQGNRPDLVRGFCYYSYPAFQPNKRAWDLKISETQNIGSYSEGANGGMAGGGFVFND